MKSQKKVFFANHKKIGLKDKAHRKCHKEKINLLEHHNNLFH